MNEPSEDLHGNVPDASPVVLLIVDMINDLEFPEGASFLEATVAAARQLVQLKTRAKAAGIPVVYINDNFGRWRSSFDDLLTHCLTDDVRGRPVAEIMRPDPDDYVVLKPKHSVFYATTLEPLLTSMKATTLILTGIAADVCIQFSAIDAYMRDLKLIIPTDCVASGSEQNTQNALEYMKRVLSANVAPAAELDLEDLISMAD